MDKYTRQIVTPEAGSHKGENGRVLVIGGSKLFHAAPFWAASATAKIVDMVHFTSPAMENNDLMRVRAKGKFWDGIVIPWEEVEHYIAEDDCILIGPGMTRAAGTETHDSRFKIYEDTKNIVDTLLRKFPDKRWVVDGGALQEVDVKLLNKNMIVTPNVRELEIVAQKAGFTIQDSRFISDRKGVVAELAGKLGEVTILAKGPVDVVTNGTETEQIAGGNPGMTKGGTGDVLAGIVAGLYAKSPAMAAAVVAARANKAAGDALHMKQGIFFGASDLLSGVSQALAQLL